MSEHSTELDNILAQCLDAIETDGWTVEECLARYPDYGHDLDPLLRMAARLRQASAVRPSEAFRQGAGGRLQARIEASRRLPSPSVTKQSPVRSIGRPTTNGQRRLKMLAVLVAIVVVVVAATGGVLVASDDAGPGDLLYGVDRTIEQVRLDLAFGDKSQAQLLLGLADERLEEAKKELDGGADPDHLDEALASYDEAIAAVESLLGSASLSPEERMAIEAALATLRSARGQAGLGGEDHGPADEPALDVTPEPTLEVTLEPTPEGTPEPTAEATPEAEDDDEPDDEDESGSSPVIVETPSSGVGIGPIGSPESPSDDGDDHHDDGGCHDCGDDDHHDDDHHDGHHD